MKERKRQDKRERAVMCLSLLLLEGFEGRELDKRFFGEGKASGPRKKSKKKGGQSKRKGLTITIGR